MNSQMSNKQQWNESDGGKGIYTSNNVGIGTSKPMHALDVVGNINVSSAIYVNGVKNFVIEHPVRPNYYLVHCAVEGPRIDLLYRGVGTLINGQANVNVTQTCNMTGGMVAGTLNALARNFSVFLQNRTGFAKLKGTYSNEQINVVCEDMTSNDTFDWMLICERQDANVKNLDVANAEGLLMAEIPRPNV